MRVGIIGYKGFVGSALYKVFLEDSKYEVVGIERENYPNVNAKYFDLIINSDGNSSKILAEKDPILDLEMNVISTLRFLQELNYTSYIHISTVEVYNHKDSAAKTVEDLRIDMASLSNYGFSKFCSECLVRKHTKNWIIIRLGSMVGEGMKKGPAYDIINDGKLFVSRKSRYQFINTKKVAEITKLLFERKKFCNVYNIVGKGNIMLSKLASDMGIVLKSEGKSVQIFNISTKKIDLETLLPTSRKTLSEFIKEYKNKEGWF